MTDEFELQRFVDAQDAGGAYESALAELRRGRKTGHWMWFVFPQLDGLGSSPMARRYALRSLAEAVAYLRHPVLGPRLTECAAALVALTSGSASEVLGGIDAMKLRSSMTLFQQAAPADPVFGAVLDRFFDGEPDPRTEALLNR